MRLLKESGLQIWKARRGAGRKEIATADRVAKAIQDERVTSPAFSYLQPTEDGIERMVDQTGASWNHVKEWLSRLDAVRRAV